MSIMFIADSMLGKLARWLRFFGYDTLYFRKIDDLDLLRLASKENRILLTSDKELFKTAIKKGIGALLINNKSLIDQLVILYKVLKLNYNLNPAKPRCVKCNTILNKPKNNVPTRLINKQNLFYCPSCNTYYWEGRMWKNIVSFYNSLQKRIKSD